MPKKPATKPQTDARDRAKLWSAVVANLRAAATKENAAFYQRVAPTAGRILGVKVPVIRAHVKAFAAANRDLSLDDAIALADQALESRCREEQLFAAFLLARYRRQLGPDAWPAVSRWVDAIDNWEACDQLAMGVAGEIVARHPQLIRDLEEWAGSPSPWRRRFAVACTTVLNQKGRSDARAALRVCERLVADPDRSVAKAVGWALREACKSDASAVFEFLLRHRDAMPARLLRESAEKLPPSQQKRLGLMPRRAD